MIIPKWVWLALLGIVLFTAGPLLIALPSVAIYTILGCSGGNEDPCTFLGIDIHIFLNILTMFHWLLLFTMPVGTLAIIAWLTVALGLLVRRMVGKGARGMTGLEQRDVAFIGATIAVVVILIITLREYVF
jgi:hypothetical protein